MALHPNGVSQFQSRRQWDFKALGLASAKSQTRGQGTYEAPGPVLHPITLES